MKAIYIVAASLGGLGFLYLVLCLALSPLYRRVLRAIRKGAK